MPKFSGTKRRPLRTNLTAPLATTNERIRTHEGGEAFARDPESELFTLAAAYEQAAPWGDRWPHRE